MASTRFRKTFRYPDSESDDNLREELDEQEQETLIQKLRDQDEERNTQYKLMFTILPVVSSIIYFPFFLTSGRSALQRLLCFLGISSLLSTAWIMWNFALSRRDKKGKRPMRDIERENTPLRRYLGPTNALVCAFLLSAAYLLGPSSDSKDILRVLYVVPGGKFETPSQR
ncbi:hypothetical protein PRK78_001009 [Emydomyces testavorans]|uniref:Transmembrane protein n=1 Tax=Emydomyces testavorans TaxID=2070801 RepID=A0AAF0DC61_9EURO|nr:hypothetical protein PRK78_001009 [Emydomyces testavorans]